MNANNSITNEERANFLRKLDVSELLVTDWEAKFIASFLQAHAWWNWFTEGRIKSTDRMWMKYGAEMGMPLPQSVVNGPESKVKFTEADPSGCQFLVMNESRRQVPCNEPASKMRRNGFRYCEAHAEQVVRDAKRRGTKLVLVDAPVRPGAKTVEAKI